ncbi:MAG: universal stress protein [Dehalococcoidales bacterium]|nr:universal stress protein [Dehalococcoidales bacterium]
MFDKILVCLDGSKLAEQILPYVVEQAKRFRSKIVLFQAYTIPATTFVSATPGTVNMAPNLIQQEEQRLKKEAVKYLEEVAESLRENGLEVECVVVEGSAGNLIVSYAQDEAVDLIALATHGHSGLSRIVFGSVADQVLRESGLPILIIKPQEIED